MTGTGSLDIVSDLVKKRSCVVMSLRRGRSEEVERVSLDNYFWKFDHKEKAQDRAVRDQRRKRRGRQEEVFRLFVLFCL